MKMCRFSLIIDDLNNWISWDDRRRPAATSIADYYDTREDIVRMGSGSDGLDAFALLPSSYREKRKYRRSIQAVVKHKRMLIVYEDQ